MLRHLKIFSLVSLIVFSCSKSETKKELTPIGFNGFPWGTPADSIIYVLGSKPDIKSDSRLSYRDITFESVDASDVTYDLAGGRLVGGMFISLKPQKSDFDTLYTRFSARYGEPKKIDENTYQWVQPNQDHLFLTKDKGSLNVMARRYTPDR